MEIREDIGDQSGGGGSGVNLRMPLLSPSSLGSEVGGDLPPHSPPAPDHIQSALRHLQAALEHIQAAHEHIQDAGLLQQDVAQDATLPQNIAGPAPPTCLQVVIRIGLWPLMLAECIHRSSTLSFTSKREIWFLKLKLMIDEDEKFQGKAASLSHTKTAINTMKERFCEQQLHRFQDSCFGHL